MAKPFPNPQKLQNIQLVLYEAWEVVFIGFNNQCGTKRHVYEPEKHVKPNLPQESCYINKPDRKDNDVNGNEHRFVVK